MVGCSSRQGVPFCQSKSESLHSLLSLQYLQLSFFKTSYMKIGFQSTVIHFIQNHCYFHLRQFCIIALEMWIASIQEQLQQFGSCRSAQMGTKKITPKMSRKKILLGDFINIMQPPAAQRISIWFWSLFQVSHSLSQVWTWMLFDVILGIHLLGTGWHCVFLCQETSTGQQFMRWQFSMKFCILLE